MHALLKNFPTIVRVAKRMNKFPNQVVIIDNLMETKYLNLIQNK